MWKVALLTIMLLVAVGVDSTATETVSFTIPETNTFGWCQMCTNPTDIYGGDAVEIRVENIAAIQSAELELDLGFIHVAEVTIPSHAGEFFISFQSTSETLSRWKIQLNRVASSTDPTGIGRIVIQPDYSNIFDEGLGYGLFQILSASVKTVYGESANVQIDDGSWYIYTDTVAFIPVEVYSFLDGSPVPDVEVELLGFGDAPLLFTDNKSSIPNYGIPPTDITGKTEVFYLPIHSLYKYVDRQEPISIVLILSLSPPTSSGFEKQIRSTTAVVTFDLSSALFSTATVYLSSISAVTEWMVYR